MILEFLGYRSLMEAVCLFLLIIFLLSLPMKSVAEKWTKRIDNAVTRFGAELKQIDGKPIVSVNLYPDSVDVGDRPREVDFTGILFSYDGRRPKEAIDEVDFLKKRSASASSCSCTYRQLASVVGQCLWMYRVRAERLYGKSDYRRVSQLSFPKASKKWSDKTVVKGADFEALLRVYRDGLEQSHITPHRLYGARETVVYLATDASYSASAGGRIGYAFSDVHRVDDVVSGAVSSVPTRVRYEEMEAEMGESQIALQELRAVVDAVEHMKRDLPEMPVILLCWLLILHM